MKVICISLADNFGSSVVEMVANDLNVFFMNIDDYIEYSLVNVQEIIQKSGIEYFKQREKIVIQKALEYENTIYYISFETFVNNMELFEEFEIFYIAFSHSELKKLNEQNFVVNDIAFNDRDAFLKEFSYTITSDFPVQKIYSNKIVQIIRSKNENYSKDN